MRKNLLIKKYFKKGFSLIEIIITIAILTGVLSLIGLFQSDIFSMNNLINDGLNNQYETKQLLKSFNLELRTATTSPNGDYPLAQAGTSTLIFYANIDNEEDIEKVSYLFDGTDFKKFVIKPTEGNIYDENNKVLLKEVENVEQGVIFKYYDSISDGSFAATPLSEPINILDIRLIKLKLQIGSDFETRVAPRNLKNN